MARHRFEFFLGAAFLIIGLVCLVIAGWRHQERRAFFLEATPVTGEVVEVVLQTRSGSRLWFPVVAFVDASGQRHEFIGSTGSNPAAYEVGERVELGLPGGDPGAAEIRPRSLDFWVWITLLLAVPFLLFGAGILSAPWIKRLRRPRRKGLG